MGANRMIPRSFCKKDIKIGKKVIGHIKLVKYQVNGLPHVEYSLIEEYWNQRIMSVELPKFFKKCKKLGIPRLIAMVKHDNKASVKLLEKNRFIKIAIFDDKVGYILAQDLIAEISEFNNKAIKSISL